MGYGNPPLEEIKTSELIAEIGRRHALTAEERCVYCFMPLSEHRVIGAPVVENEPRKLDCRYNRRQQEIHDVF